MQAIIGGSGLAQFAELHLKRREVVRTPFGDPSCALSFGAIDGVDVVFLARHGYGHTIAPHEINYRANLWALHHVGATAVVSVAAVGGIRADFGPGSIVLPDQIIDYTHGRKGTFFEGPDYPVTHVDFTLPYDETLRTQLAQAAASIGEATALGGTYGCMQGPRLETAAEIRRLERDGCDLVGMTGMPEATLARELSLPYATLAVVANHAAGKGDSREEISMEAIGEALDSTMVRVRRILSAFIRRCGAVQPVPAGGDAGGRT
jgi:5'-deoxy-5'-methylthioadenosine phosphorylase